MNKYWSYSDGFRSVNGYWIWVISETDDSGSRAVGEVFNERDAMRICRVMNGLPDPGQTGDLELMRAGYE